MSIDFTTLQALEIPEGVVTKIEDASGRVIWMVASGEPIVLEVKKITSDTYAGETTYTAEEFILLDIYPKTNGTVTVTYGGLTKTITDTSGAAEPNAQQVFFGTFNGMSDEVETPASGILTIEGEYSAISVGIYQSGSKSANRNRCGCINAIYDLGSVEKIPNAAFTNCYTLESVTIPDSVIAIGRMLFDYVLILKRVNFENKSGWYVTETVGGDISTGTAVDVSDPATNATMLKDTYSSYYWYRS